MYDYVIVGGGSAGCVLAGRLSEDPSVKVCLLEAGPVDRSVFIRAPLGFAATAPLKINSWGYETVPQPGFNGRRGFQPRGKVLGGSSSVNAMVYTRGNRRDYDEWASAGNPGWGYADVLPLFKRSENNECFGATEYRGVGGPLNVKWLTSPSPLNDDFQSACEQRGYARNPDYNAARQFGVSSAQVTQIAGERCSAARAYLHPALARPNLTVITGAHTSRVLFSGRRATGIEYLSGGQRHEVEAAREVILSGGAFGSPQILMLSGIGPGDELKRHGIAVHTELPGVGQNLHDHVTVVLIQRTADHAAALGISIPGVATMVRSIMEWRAHRTGWVTTNVAESQGFISTEGNEDYPDVQLALCVGIVDDHTRKSHLGHGYTLHTTLMRPKSRGAVTLASADPLAAPHIDPAFFKEGDDLKTLARALALGHDILQAPALDRYRGPLMYPVNPKDAIEVERFLRRHSDTEYHPVGTCRMGPAGDRLAVVDPELRVHGVEGLRVVDASIMPRITTGNTNAPTIMIAEKAVDLIRGGRREAKSGAPAPAEALA